MRAFRVVLTLVVLAAATHAVVTQAPPAQAPTSAAAAILAAARTALGGEQKLAEVRTFTATGRTRQIRGNNLVPIEFEIWCELPDKYVRRDEVPAQESGPTSTGFSSDTLIQWPPAAEPAQGGRGGHPERRANPHLRLAKPRRSPSRSTLRPNLPRRPTRAWRVWHRSSRISCA